MIKQSLNVSATQQLQLTPKLQQAIHMLQLSSQELAQELHAILDSNIMLEAEEEMDIPLSQLEKGATNPSDSSDSESSENKDELFQVDMDSAQTFEQPKSQGAKEDPITAVVERYYQSSCTLKEHLAWQLNLAHITEKQKLIGEMLIDAINDHGFLELTLADMCQSLQETYPQLTLTEVEKVLGLIQTFDPVGIGARDLQEALSLQLNALPANTPYLDLAKTVIQQHIQLLAEHNFLKICRFCKVTQTELDKAIRLIQSLNPRPGNAIGDANCNIITPDVIVKREGKTWKVSLNHLVIPKLRLNHSYTNILDTSQDSSSQQFINNHLQEARWVMKCLHNRNETLLKVASCIVKHQQAFFGYGEAAMKPLTLRDIAEDLDMHQSTISRITTRKYIQTPRGTFELKYFFSSQLSTSYGQSCSAMAIQTFIQEIVKSENPQKPFSDEMISKKLLSQGIQVARRTIAKYREHLAIPPASERKFIKLNPL